MKEEEGKGGSPQVSGKEDNSGEMERHCTYTDQDWESIFNSITDMVTIHDRDFNIICANRAAEKILKLPMLNVGKAKCYEYYHGTECPPEGCPSCRCLITGEPSTSELFEPHLNRFLEIRAIPRFDGSNNVTGLIHIVRDITKRKRTEEELQRHRHHLEELVGERTAELKEERDKAQNYLDVAGVMIIVIAADHRVKLINRRGCEILDCGEQGVIGKNWFDTFIPENIRGEIKKVFDGLMEGDVVPVEYHENPIVTLGGEERLVAWHNAVLRDDEGNIVGTLSSGQDITENKRAEAERERLIAELQDALARIKTLSGLIPICAWCKKIRDDKGYWKQVEEYIREHSDAEFTHSICKECMKKMKFEEGE